MTSIELLISTILGLYNAIVNSFPMPPSFKWQGTFILGSIATFECKSNIIKKT